MDPSKTNNFDKALLAAERAVELFEGGPEATHEFHVKADSVSGTITIQNYSIYVQDKGPNRVMARNLLLGSYSDPVEAVIAAMGEAVADRAKKVLEGFLINEGLR